MNYGRIENNRSKNIHFDVSKGVVNDLVFIPTMYHVDVFQIYTGKYIQSLSGHFMPVNCCCYNKSYQVTQSGCFINNFVSARVLCCMMSSCWTLVWLFYRSRYQHSQLSPLNLTLFAYKKKSVYGLIKHSIL